MEIQVIIIRLVIRLCYINVDNSLIYKVFEKIDSLIDLDFEQINSKSNSLINLYATEYDPNNNTLGEAFVMDNYVDIEFKETYDVRENKLTIIHELGHALGLDHPDGDGENPKFDISDTMMSYNGNEDLNDLWFTDSDIYALQKLWGKENDIVSNTTSSAVSRKARIKNETEINKEAEGQIIPISSILVDQDLASSLNSNTNNIDKLIFNIEKVSNNYLESDKNNTKNKLDNFDDNISHEWNIQSEKNKYFSEKIVSNKDYLFSDFSKKYFNAYNNLDLDNNHLSKNSDNFINNILDKKISPHNNKNDNFDIVSVTHGINDNDSNINRNLELTNNNFSYTDISLDIQSIKPLVEVDNLKILG